MGSPIYTLRAAKESDLELLFGIMMSSSGSGKVYDDIERFKKFKENFLPGQTWVIQHIGKDIGRLRVRRDTDIYVGGMHLMPGYQGLGIGSAILTDLIAESESTGLPIRFEVHSKNFRTQRLHEKLGFLLVGFEERKDTGRFFKCAYFPSTYRATAGPG